MSTGYTDQRAAPHEYAAKLVAAELRERGVGIEALPPDGHRPDYVLAGGTYLDVKTSTPGRPNMAIELDSLDEYRRIELIERSRVLIVHVRGPEPSSWTVDTPSSVARRIIGGPRRRSGNGSRDDWYLIQSDPDLYDVAAGGTPFDDWFGE